MRKRQNGECNVTLDSFLWYEFWCTGIQNLRYCKWIWILNWGKWILVVVIPTQILLTMLLSKDTNEETMYAGLLLYYLETNERN